MAYGIPNPACKQRPLWVDWGGLLISQYTHHPEIDASANWLYAISQSVSSVNYVAALSSNLSGIVRSITL